MVENVRFVLYRMEQCLKQNPSYTSEYNDFLTEYENLGHMTKSLPTEIVKPEQHYYIPHHAVLRNSNTITWLRVVPHDKWDVVKRSYALNFKGI